jgi:Ni,Fe-hydrogenase III component G
LRRRLARPRERAFRRGLSPAVAHGQNFRIRVKVMTDEDTPVPRSQRCFPAPDWFEREAYDLYGILFPAIRICAAS